MKLVFLLLCMLPGVLFSDDFNLLLEKAKSGNVEAQMEVAKSYRYGKKVGTNIGQSVYWYEKAAEQNNVDAMLTLAGMYNFGLQGIKEDHSEAVRWWLKAASLGSVPATSFLGSAYFYGKGVAVDQAKGIEFWTKAAEKNQYVAQCNLADAYFEGNGVSQNYNTAYNWYSKSAATGYVKALANLGFCYFKGLGVNQDKLLGKDIIESGVIRNDETAIKFWKDFDLGNAVFEQNTLVKKDLSEEQKRAILLGNVDELIKKSQEGDPAAQNALAGYYLKGHKVPIDKGKAVELIKKSAEAEYGPSLYMMSIFYLDGKTFKKDDEKAFEYAKKAAEKNYARAQVLLFGLYRKGVGTEEDLEEGKKWLLKALEQNDVSALMAVSNYHRKGSLGFTKNLIFAEVYMKRASFSGKPQALYGYADLLLLVNMEKAMEIMKEAAVKGHPDALQLVGTAYYHGMFYQKKNIDLGLKYLKEAAAKGNKDAIKDLKRIMEEVK